MNMQRSEVFAKSLLLLDTNVLEVLVSEDDNASLGDQQSKLVLLLIVQLRELQTSDLGANDRRKLADLDVRVVLGDEVGLVFVGIKATVVELERLKGSQVCLLIVYREIRLVGVVVLRRYRISLTKDHLI